MSENGGDGRKPVTAASISAQIGGELYGDEDLVISGVAPLDRAGAGDVSIFSSARYADWYAATTAGLVLVSRDLASVAGSPRARIVVDKPVDAMVSILSHFHRADPRVVGVHATAVVSPTAVIGENVCVEAFAVIGDRVVIGNGAWIGAHAFVGEDTVIGENSRLHPGARVYPRCEIGNRVVVHGGANIGREGFGWVTSTGQRVPHVGRCVLSDDVEIGANTCVDRGSIDDTIIGAGTKVDNLCQIAHNVRIGRMCFLASQVGIAGSARIEDGVQIGGQAGLQGHITVGAGAVLGGQAGVLGDVPATQFWSGYPARPHREQLRSHAAMARLVKIVRPLEELLSGRGDTE
ncbi:MAG: UDP-3-O-(3-hydroxymyristoyl)glucosamine N-acyltransferase [Phycisphaerae bacterium]|nr:UDP-3-O-(3-hydroxymyristoyl)glucosamine N-acyltransferase [Gemmatimonadaceae bacterium]